MEASTPDMNSVRMCPVILPFLHVQNMSKLEKKTQVWGRRAEADSWQCTQHMPKQRCHSRSCSTASSRTVDIHSIKKKNGIQTSDSELPQQVWFHTNQWYTGSYLRQQTPVLSSLFPCCHWQIYKRCMRERQALSKQAQHPVHCSLDTYDKSVCFPCRCRMNV